MQCRSPIVHNRTRIEHGSPAWQAGAPRPTARPGGGEATAMSTPPAPLPTPMPVSNLIGGRRAGAAPVPLASPNEASFLQRCAFTALQGCRVTALQHEADAYGAVTGGRVCGVEGVMGGGECAGVSGWDGAAGVGEAGVVGVDAAGAVGGRRGGGAGEGEGAASAVGARAG